MSNSSLVLLTQDNQVVTTSEIIARAIGVHHKNTLDLIKKYSNEIKELGLLAFKTRARLPGQHGGGDVSYALLNEQQATFLISLSRNTPKVVEFKLALTKAFFEAREALNKIKVKNKDEHQSYLKIFKDFCLQHNYSSEEIKMFDYLREQALKQGYAIAMSKFEKENNSTNNNDDGKIRVDFSTVLRMLNLANGIAGRFKYYTEAVHLMEKTLQNIDIIKSDTEYLCGLGDMQMPILRKSLLRASYTDEQKKLIDKTLYPYNQD